jgi:hypothetical protein
MTAEKYGDSEIRTVVTAGEPHEYSETALPDPVTNLKQIEKIISTETQQGFDFIEHEIPSIPVGPLRQTGVLWRKVKLSDLRVRTNRPPRTEAFDGPVLRALDSLCRRGRLKVFDLRFHRDLEYHDVLVSCEIGLGVKSFDGNGPPTIEIVRLYSKEPLTAQEMKSPHIIRSPKAVIEELKSKRDEQFRKRFGWRDFDLEHKLHRKQVMEEIALKRKLVEAVDEMKSLKAKLAEKSG